MKNAQTLRIAMTTCDNVFDSSLGVGNSVGRIARGLVADYNLQVDILMLDPGQQVPFNPHGMNGITLLEQPIDGLSIFRVGPWTAGMSPAQHWVDIHYALLELIGERQYDLLQAFYPSITGFPTVYAARELGLPTVASVRGNDINRDVFHTGRFHHLRWALENATQMTALSQEALDRARLVCACPTKGRVILNCIRPDDYTDGRRELHLPRPVVGSLARFKNKKGLEVLLCAFKMVLQRYPTAHLLLVGYVIPEEQSTFERLVAHYEVGNRMTMTGRVPRRDVLQYLRTMDVFVCSSLQDASPSAVLEAMLAGLPIVATRAGSLPEMIEDGKQRLLVRPGSATELSDAIVRLLSDDTEKLEVARQAQARVLTQFAPHVELQAYLQVYQECLGREVVS